MGSHWHNAFVTIFFLDVSVIITLFMDDEKREPQFSLELAQDCRSIVRSNTWWRVLKMQAKMSFASLHSFSLTGRPMNQWSWLTLYHINLEHLLWFSVCDPAQWIWMKKIHRMLVWLRKMVLAQHNCAGCSSW
jgi:hypothetical protein